MAIYTPNHFASRDEVAALQLIHDHPFATLITGIEGAEMQISHVPLIYSDGALFGHVAKPNVHWEKFEQGNTTALFHGPHAFVSPYWYEKPTDNVPTWNYAVVHVHGRPGLLDESDKQPHLEQLFARFGGGARLPTDQTKMKRLLNGIVAFRMPIERMNVKFKMSQNKTQGDREGVITGLQSSGRPEDSATALWMITHD